MRHQLLRIPSASGTASRSRTGRVRSARDIPGRYPGRYPGQLSRAGAAHATRIAAVPSESGFIDALVFSARHPPRRVSYDGTVTMLSLRQPVRPARAATHQTDAYAVVNQAASVGYMCK